MKCYKIQETSFQKCKKKKITNHNNCTVSYCTVLYDTVWYWNTLYCNAVYHIALYCTIRHSSLAYCIRVVNQFPINFVLTLMIPWKLLELFGDALTSQLAPSADIKNNFLIICKLWAKLICTFLLTTTEASITIRLFYISLSFKNNFCIIVDP